MTKLETGFVDKNNTPIKAGDKVLRTIERRACSCGNTRDNYTEKLYVIWVCGAFYLSDKPYIGSPHYGKLELFFEPRYDDEWEYYITDYTKAYDLEVINQEDL
jgi:hypothetical protein